MLYLQIMLSLLIIFNSSPILAQKKNQPYKFIVQDGLEEVEEVSPDQPAVKKAEDEPIPAKKKWAKNELLKLPPKQAGKKPSVDFLEGCWVCETGLFSVRTGEPLVVEYCFDKNGQGTSSVTEPDGAKCQGPVRATYDGRLLVLKADNAPCRGGRAYPGQKVQCRDGGSEAVCSGQNEGSGIRWDARFRRK